MDGKGAGTYLDADDFRRRNGNYGNYKEGISTIVNNQAKTRAINFFKDGSFKYDTNKAQKAGLL